MQLSSLFDCQNDRAALHVACRNSHKEVANALLVYGADLFVADSVRVIHK
jgi:hypothetical protein